MNSREKRNLAQRALVDINNRRAAANRPGGASALPDDPHERERYLIQKTKRPIRKPKP